MSSRICAKNEIQECIIKLILTLFFLSVKPRTDIKNTQYTLHNDEVLIINCTLKPKFYPWHVNFTWYKCKFHNCENGRDSWVPVSYKYSLFINKEGMGKTKYRCTARNTAGKDTSPVINVDYKGKVFHWIRQFPFLFQIVILNARK